MDDIASIARAAYASRCEDEARVKEDIRKRSTTLFHEWLERNGINERPIGPTLTIDGIDQSHYGHAELTTGIIRLTYHTTLDGDYVEAKWALDWEFPERNTLKDTVNDIAELGEFIDIIERGEAFS